MTLIVVAKGVDGIALAADKRVTLHTPSGEPAYFDNATKLHTLNQPWNKWVGVLHYGTATIGGRTPLSLLPEFEEGLKEVRLPVSEYARLLSDFFMARHTPASSGDAGFIIAGYDEFAPYGTVYHFSVPSTPRPTERRAGKFGMSWGGQVDTASRILNGFDDSLPKALQEQPNLSDEQRTAILRSVRRGALSIPDSVLALQDWVDWATFLVRATRMAQRLTTGPRGVGDEIDVATITKLEGFQWVKRSEIRAGQTL